jgi:PIN domain nuclease of toxin-antitoxin system
VSYLLDTHVWVWLALEPERLPGSVRRSLSAEDAVPHLSPLSVDEAIQLGVRGRVSLQPDPISWARTLLATTGLQEEPLTFEIAEAAARVVVGTKDPMDRLIAATARVRGLTLVTADRRLANVPGVDVLAFRPAR